MNRACVLGISFSLVLLLVLVVSPQSTFAQRAGFHGGSPGFHGGGFGGHGRGGGGFHNGGGSYGYRGGSFHNGFGGFHGGGFGGFGHDGFRHRPFFGGFPYPWYGWDFAFGVSPYWDPWFWGYGPWSGAPYLSYYSYDFPPDDGYYYRRYDNREDYDGCRSDYRHPDNGCTDHQPARPNRENPPAKPSNTPDNYRDRHYLTGDVEDYRSPDTSPVFTTPDVQLISAGPQNSAHLRPAVNNAIHLLRAMPPAARERYLNSDLYDSFSPQERELLNRDLEWSAIKNH